MKTAYRVSLIEMKVNGSLVRKYALGYDTGDGGYLSMLFSVTKSGHDGSATTTLPATTFSYGLTTEKRWVNDTSYDLPDSDFIDSEGRDKGLRVLDVNSDGMDDIVNSDGNGNLYVNQGNGSFTLDNTINFPEDAVYVSATNYDTGVRYGDWNGDLLVDMTQIYNDGGDQEEYKINQGDGEWALDSSYNMNSFFVDASNGYDNGFRILDVNGDGLVDFIQAKDGTKTNNFNRGNGVWDTVATTTFNTFSETFISSTNLDMGARFGEVNGDGLIDVVVALDSLKEVYINTGKGWSNTQGYSTTTFSAFTSNTGHDYGWRLFDVNGDGLVDMVRGVSGSPSDRKVLINKGDGTGWVEDTGYTLDFSTFAGALDGKDSGRRIGDLNGDRLMDMFDGVGGANKYAALARDDGFTNLLKSATTSDGGIMNIRYAHTAAQRFQKTTEPNNKNFPINMSVVATTTYNDGLGNTWTATSSYGGGYFYFATPFDRKFAGFATSTATDGEGNMTITYFHQGTSTLTAEGEYDDHVSKIGLPYKVEKRDSAGNVYQRAITKWDKTNLGKGRTFAGKIRETTISLDGDSDHKDSAVTYAYASTTALTTSRIEWGDVSGDAGNGDFTDLSDDKRTTSYLYATKEASSTSFVYNETLTNATGTKVRESRHYYDSLSLGTADKGNRTKDEQWLNSGNSYLATTRAFNAQGLPTSETDPRSQITAYSYDSRTLYPVTTTRPHSLTTTNSFDYATGKVQLVQHPNGGIASTTYDGLGRPTSIQSTDASNPNGSLITKTEFTYTDTARPRQVRTRDYLTGSLYRDTHDYLDGFDRVIQTRISSETSGTYASVQKRYDSEGRVIREYLPTHSSGSSFSTTTQTNTEAINTSYDVTCSPSVPQRQ